jgi:hypothetical protein
MSRETRKNPVATVADVGTVALADGQVTGPKIAAGAVSLAKLAATGTRDATTFLNGLDQFATPPAATIAAVSTIGSGTIDIATNGDCELSVAGWSAAPGTAGACTGAQSASAAHSGTYGYRVTWTTASTFSGAAQYDQNGIATGVAYVVDAWIRSSVTKNFRIRVLYRNAAAAVIETDDGSDVSAVANTWVHLTLNTTCATAAANWATIQLLCPDAGIPISTNIDFDDLQILTVDPSPPGVTRPDADHVFFIGGTTAPASMLNDVDVWLKEV